MAGWHHQLNGHELGKLRELLMDTLACCGAWGREKLDTTEQLNCTEKSIR